jgi:Zinc knuckle
MKNPYIVCWKCNQKGHVQSNCPKNKANEEKGMVASEENKTERENKTSFMAFEKATKNLNLWIGNTSASTHMKNTMESLYDLREEQTTINFMEQQLISNSTTWLTFLSYQSTC